MKASDPRERTGQKPANPVADPPDNAVVEFREVGLQVSSGRSLVFGLNFSVRRGETLVLLGRSGSGKTTTLKLINRLLDPTSGEVRVEGKSTGDWDPIRLRRRIGYVIQETGLFPHLTVERNVSLVPRLEGWPEQQAQSRVSELLNLVGLDPDVYSDRYPRELSGGQRQRVGVARAIAADPPIVLMDEPFGALDPLTRVELQSEFRDLVRRLNKTIIFVTHDVREAFTLATRVGLFKEGRMVVLAAPREFARSDDPEAVAFTRSLTDSGRAMLNIE